MHNHRGGFTKMSTPIHPQQAHTQARVAHVNLPNAPLHKWVPGTDTVPSAAGRASHCCCGPRSPHHAATQERHGWVMQRRVGLAVFPLTNILTNKTCIISRLHAGLTPEREHLPTYAMQVQDLYCSRRRYAESCTPYVYRRYSPDG